MPESSPLWYRVRAAQQPLNFLPERLPRLSLVLGEAVQRCRVVNAGQDVKAAKNFEHLPGRTRLGGTGARQTLRLRRHFGADQPQRLLPQPRAGGLGGRGDHLSALPSGLTDPEYPLRLGLARRDTVAIAL